MIIIVVTWCTGKAAKLLLFFKAHEHKAAGRKLKLNNVNFIIIIYYRSCLLLMSSILLQIYMYLLES